MPSARAAPARERKELSLLMIYQSLGSFEIDRHLSAIQIVTFLLFLTLYVPCISTFAAMLKTIGRREVLFSVPLSVGVAILIAGLARFALEAAGRAVSGLIRGTGCGKGPRGLRREFLLVPSALCYG